MESFHKFCSELLKTAANFASGAKYSKTILEKIENKLEKMASPTEDASEAGINWS